MAGTDGSPPIRRTERGMVSLQRESRDDGCGTPLVGRAAELGRVLAPGRPDWRGPRDLLVLGEAGAGKTALLETAAHRLRQAGTLVLRARGNEAESRFPFAGLHQLLLPLSGELGGLPEHLRAPLEAAFGTVAAPRPPDPMLLRIAVLTLVTRTAARRPVALVVDDVQHFDRDSADVLGFVTRRLADPGVTVLLAARGHVPPPRVNAETPVLTLGLLTERAATRLLDAQLRPPVGRARLELLRQARGNPLAIIELCRAADRSGAPLEGVAEARLSRLQETFAARARELPDATRRALLYAAADDHGDLATITRAAGHGADLGVWRPAEEAGLVVITATEVEFRHPLVRSAVYRTAPAQSRRQAHHDLAAALEDEPERAAWHRAGACLGPDESLAAALEEPAERAARRGGRFAAARALERAAECSPADHDRARRYDRALGAADRAGDPRWVRELYERVTRLSRDPDMLGAAACGAGLALSMGARQREAFGLMASALEHRPPRDGRVTLALVSVMAAVAFQSGLPEMRRPLPGLLAEVRIGPAVSAPFAEMDGLACELVGKVVLASADPVAHAPALLDPAARTPLREPAEGAAEMTRLLALGAVAWYADESDLCVESFRAAFAGLRAGEAMGSGATCLVPMAAALIDTGRWGEADAMLEEAAAVAAVHRLEHVAVDVRALRATLAALRGRHEPLGDDAWTAVDLAENRATHAHLLRAAAAQAEAAGDLEDAYRHLRALYDDGTALHYVLSMRSIVELAAVARRTGRQEEAAPLVEAARAEAGPRPTARMALLLHHATALLDDSPDAERHFRLAIVNPAAQQWPLQRARARLDYARWLRRRRRPLEARPLLSAALETFTRLGARAPAEQAAAELRASGVSGESARASGDDPLASLTAQQQQIVRLAAEGLGNREIAERLMLSPRTIGSHLYQAFPKLGVSSRHQLRDILERG
ncbi:LuxR family transcriptional regulator [Actinomadura kijaniata]